EAVGGVPYAGPAGDKDYRMPSLSPGQVGGMIVDPSGAVIPNASVTVMHPETGTTLTATTDDAGRWIVSNVPSGHLTITASANGFNAYVQEANYDASRPSVVAFNMQVGAVNQIVTVHSMSSLDTPKSGQVMTKQARKRALEAENAASANV